MAQSGINAFTIFTTFLVLHAPRRHCGKSVAGSEHDFGAGHFVRRALGFYIAGKGRDLRPLVPVYVSQSPGTVPSLRHGRTLVAAPLVGLRIFFANILKVRGFFSDAEDLYEVLTQDGSSCPLALTGLGDLLLLRAGWNREREPYLAGGILLDVLGEGRSLGQAGSYSDAIRVLQQAVALGGGADSQWLLAMALLGAGRHSEAVAALEAYRVLAHEIPGALGADFQVRLARARLGLDGNAALEDYRSYLGEWSGWIRVDRLDLESEAEHVARTGLADPARVEEAALQLKSKIILSSATRFFKNVATFPASAAKVVEDAEILPGRGVIAGGERLLSGSFPIPPVHWPLFSPCLIALSDREAIVSRRSAVRFEVENCIYIGSNDNYYHFIIDEIGRLAAIEDDPRFASNPILIDDRARLWQRQLLVRLGIPQSRFKVVDFTVSLLARQLVLPPLLSRNMIAHPKAVQFLRRRLAPEADSASPVPGRRLYLARRSLGIREARLLNERSLIERFKRAGFSIVDTGSMSLGEQIELFSGAEVIAGPGGAAFTNILFTPKEARMLTLAPTGVICETFTSIAHIIGQDAWCCAGVSYARPHPQWFWTTFDFEIKETDIDLALEQVL
ncbi:MAG: DUF563 domain-containing protein [Roseomonas sp.]|nr:DUF563 domain-containing protein [Roseomonas sp.]